MAKASSLAFYRAGILDFVMLVWSAADSTLCRRLAVANFRNGSSAPYAGGSCKNRPLGHSNAGMYPVRNRFVCGHRFFVLPLHSRKEKPCSFRKFQRDKNFYRIMYWTLELASWLEDAPWSATKDELIDYANRSGLPETVLENLQEIEEDDEIFESIEDLWPDYPSKEDFLFNEEGYWRSSNRLNN